MFSWFERRVNPYPEDVETPPSTFFAFLGYCVKETRIFLVFLVILSIIGGAFEAILFAMLGNVIDWLAEIPASELWAREKNSLLWITAILLFYPFVAFLQSLIKHQTLAGNFPMMLRWKFHRHLLRQSLSFYNNEFAGRISAKVMQTSLAVRETVFNITDILAFVLVYIVTMSIVLVGFSPGLLIPFMGWLIAYIVMLCFFIPRLARASSRQADARALMTGRVTDAYTNIATVKLFSHTDREASYTRSAMERFMTTVHAQMRLVTGILSVNTLLSILLLMATSGVAVWLWSHDHATIGAVAAVTAMALRLNGLSHWVMWEMTMLFENIGIAQDGMGTLSTAPRVNDIPNAPALSVAQGEITFDHVGFAYADKKVIDDFSLTIRAGERIGLVGRSGAGKSTLVNLLLRFYEVNEGKIFIDGQNINEVTQKSLRAQIGMVTQDTSLLHRSVRENIAYGNPSADDAAITLAAERAKALSFIEELSDHLGNKNFDVLVGERGVKLSGGQRQRIAIARVILKNAPILLLDEATSALDSEIETVIQESLYQLMEGKTVVAIAHRLSTIAALDRLIVMDRGKIVEEGTHQALLKQEGLYARLWAHQSGGFLGDPT